MGRLISGRRVIMTTSQNDKGVTKMANQMEVGKHRTTITTNENDTTMVTYHQTQVVSFNRHWITLNTGDWWTQTTKTRMNQTSNQFNLGYKVHQNNGGWFVSFKGMEIRFDGNVVMLTR